MLTHVARSVVPFTKLGLRHAERAYYFKSDTESNHYFEDGLDCSVYIAGSHRTVQASVRDDRNSLPAKTVQFYQALC